MMVLLRPFSDIEILQDAKFHEFVGRIQFPPNSYKKHDDDNSCYQYPVNHNLSRLGWRSAKEIERAGLASELRTRSRCDPGEQ